MAGSLAPPAGPRPIARQVRWQLGAMMRDDGHEPLQGQPRRSTPAEPPPAPDWDSLAEQAFEQAERDLGEGPCIDALERKLAEVARELLAR